MFKTNWSRNIAVSLMLSIFFNARKLNSKKNARKILNRWGKLMQIILVKRTLYVTENAKKKKKPKSFTIYFLAKPFNFKKCPPPKSNNVHAVPTASTVALALLLLACFFGFTTICRQNGNCVDPNQTNSYRAG